MRRRDPIVVTVIAVCLSLSTSFNPAFANGLITTEQFAAQLAEVVVGQSTLTNDDAKAQRDSIQATLVNGGVDPSHAKSRVDALTDAEIAELSRHIATAPAGGLWFMPFLLVAAVIGLLIGTRDAQGGSRPANTNLFGHPRTVANTP